MFRATAILICAASLLASVVAAQDSIAPKASERAVLFPLRKTTVSAEIDGVVSSLPLKEGVDFKAGAVLACIDDRLYKESFAKAEAAVEEAKANLEFAKKSFEQAQELSTRGGVGRQELEKAKLDRDSAEARLKFAEASQKAAKLNLDFCKIQAPYHGRLVKKFVSEGEYVKAGQPVLEIQDDFSVLAVVNLPSTDAKSLGSASECRFRIDETQTEHDGRLYEHSGRINPAGRTVEAKFLIDNGDRKLMPGMSAALVSKRLK